MQHQDWRIVDIGRQTGSALTNEEIRVKEQQLRRQGKAVSIRKISNSAPDNSTKLDKATDPEKIESIKCGQEIMMARTSQNMTRKQLAQKLNKKIEIIASFENNSAKATPQNKKILNQIKRLLKMK
jgi:ribosome-binding protein aMBF1 (putative translation factor)